MTTLTFVSNGDTNGMFYWLGTRQGLSPWVNPVARQWVVGRQSTVYPNTVAAVGSADRGDTIVHSTDGVGNWTAWDLGAGTTLDVSHYAIRNRPDYEGHHLRNWVLEGTNDATAITNPAGATWIVLMTHTAETAMTAGVWRNWAVTPGTAYRHLRIRNTGTDSTGNNYMTYGEIEFYGEATAGEPPPVAPNVLSPSGITATLQALPLLTTRTASLDPVGITGLDEGQLSLLTLRTSAYFWSSTISTWKLPERTFNYVDISALGMPSALPARTYAPAWAGGSVTRTTGQIWPV